MKVFLLEIPKKIMKKFLKLEKFRIDSNALPHWELASKYDLIDFELGNKITGAGFPVYKGKGARYNVVLSIIFWIATQQLDTKKFKFLI